MLRAAGYRIGQGLWALRALITPVDFDTAGEVLSPDLLALFKRMRRSEQHHGLRVMRSLRADGHTHPDLLTAALLHDVGKSRHPFTLFDRTLVVLAKKLAPRRAAWWAVGEPRGWKRPFVIAHRHPVWSAEDIAAAGGSPLAIALARRHEDTLQGAPPSEEDRLLALLQAADSVN